MKRLLFICLLTLSLVGCDEPRTEKVYDVNDRRTYKTDLRNAFLDDGMDVKVKISGEMNDTIELDFILFSDVYVRKYTIGSLFKSMKTMGFKTAIISGHRYKHVQDLESIY